MHIPIYTTAQAHYVAFQIERILMVNALGEYARLYANAPEYQSNILMAQHVELMSSLLQSGDERMTYAMQFTSTPNVDQPNQGRIDVHCIVAMRVDTVDEAQAYAQSVYRLFNSYFRDVVWRVVADVAALLHTHDARHAVSLTRKSGFILHDRADAVHPYGLVQRPSLLARSQQTTSNRMFFISSFVTSGRQAHALFDYMLQHPVPITLSMRVQRTQLSAAEMRFCQENLDTYSEITKYPAAVAQQLAQYQQLMNGMLLRSFTLAALLNIDIISPAFVPEQLITLVGNLITQPAGGLMANQDLQYHGGYDIIHHSDYLPVAQAVSGISMRPIPATLTPERDRLPHVVDVNEAAVAFHIPRSSLTPMPGMQMQSHRQLRPPSDLSDTGTVIGQYYEHGITKPIHISEIDRTRHAYIIGQTGTGKSTVLKSMVLDDITKGRGVCVIDPHGDLINDVLAQIPVERRDDVIVVDPTQSDAPVGLNLFEYETQEEREMAIQLFQKTIELIEYARGTKAEYMGPVFWQHLRNNAYWITQDRNDPGTIIELYNMYAISGYYKRWLPYTKDDSKLTSWYHILEEESYHKAGSEGHGTFSYFASKFEDFIFDTRLRLIFGQKHSTFNFFEAMNTQKIVLINLSRGLLSEIASAFMGGVIMAKLQQAALKRAELPAQQRTVFSIYVDEFQNYTSESFVSLLSESRKYGIALTLANQFLAQIENKRITSAIMGNVGTIIAFRVGITDGEELVPRFAPEVTPNDLINLPNWQAYVSTQVQGQSRRPFSMQTIRPREELDLRVQAAVVAQSKHRYGRLRSEVERTLARSMATTREVVSTESTAKYDMHLTLSPLPHEEITLHASSTRMIATHGGGLSLWSNSARESNPRYTSIIIGLPAFVAKRIDETLLDDIWPYQQHLGDHYGAFHTWANELLSTKSLHAATEVVAYQELIDEAKADVLQYCVALLGYQMHQSRPEVPWHDIVLTKHVAVALDTQQRATVWHNHVQAYTHVEDDVCAIAGNEAKAYLLKRDGTIRVCRRSGISVLPDVHGITSIHAGADIVIACGADGELHTLGARVRNMPSHCTIRLMACGFDHVIGYDTNNQFFAWGKNDNQCGVPPHDLNGQHVVALAAGYDRSFALDAAGRLYAWGKHELSAHTMQTLNAYTVAYIACYKNDFICRTTNGIWWHNNQPLMLPTSLMPQTITHVTSNYTGDWLACRAPDQLVPLLERITAPISADAAIDDAVRHMLHDAGITTLYALLQQTHTQLNEMPFFQIHPAQLDAVVAHVQAVLGAFQIALPWPQQAGTLSALMPAQPHVGWYLRAFLSATPAPAASRQKQDGDDWGFDDDFFRDL